MNYCYSNVVALFFLLFVCLAPTNASLLTSARFVQKEQLEFGELEWLTDIGLFGEQVAQEGLAAAEVPQLPASQSSNVTSYRPNKSYMPHKKPRIEIPEEDDEHFTVPDLG